MPYGVQRSAIEEREAGFIVRGDLILLDAGVEYEVQSWMNGTVPGHVEFALRSTHTRELKVISVHGHSHLRVRVPQEER